MTCRTARPGAWSLAAALALLALLLGAALPASAAPSTKKYSATVSVGGAAPAASATVIAGGTATLLLTNDPGSNQTFASAEVTFTGVLPTAVSVTGTDGWTVTQPAGTTGTWRLTSSATAYAVTPGSSLAIAVVMPTAEVGPTAIATTVKQSNDFNGRNNSFANTGADPALLTVAAGTLCEGVCSPTFESSSTGVTAELTMTSAAPFTYVAGFGSGKELSCEDLVFGPGVDADPFTVQTSSSAGVAKTITLTFPLELMNAIPDNGTSRLPVCAGGDYAFPGSSSEGTLAYPAEGLLLDCADRTYQRLARDSATYPLAMCVASRSRDAGDVIVVISIASTRFDPSFW